MRWLLNFPLRYAPVILVATVVAAYKEPWWSAFVVAAVWIVIFPFVSPDRLQQSHSPYTADLVVETPFVALAVFVGSLLGRAWPT